MSSGSVQSAGGVPPAAAETPLRRPVRTGQENVVRVHPFDLFNVKCPPKWDPQSERLAVSYDVNDPNTRATAGRIVYRSAAVASGESEDSGEGAVLHVLSLPDGLRKHGHHELPPALRWDGKLTRGPADRIGEKVTADLAPVEVVVELWSGNEQPVLDGEEELAQREGRISRSRATVSVDALVEARWERNWVIPWGDPEEPKEGAVRMLIRVRNVREGTPVRLEVLRIWPEGPEENDQRYAITGEAPDEQPGLIGATVRGGRVLLPDGTAPEVRFNNYAQHWIESGNNFYRFRVALGDRGGYVGSSQRDWQKHERDCLHLRFTVFIHRPPGDLGYARSSARELHRFLRKQTKYFRSYLMEGPAKNAEDWIQHWRNRYIVVFAGHSACFCDHAEHPRKKSNSDEFVEMMHRGFPPDGNTCPNDITLAGFFTFEEDLKKYKQEWFDGCGHKSNVTQWSGLGRLGKDEKIIIYRGTGASAARMVYSIQRRPPYDPKNPKAPRPWSEAEATELDPEDAPRLMFYNGGCRTMLTTNFGEWLMDAGTRFHCGWVYSVLDAVDGRFLPEFFRRWIKGTRADPAAVEYDVERIPEVYRQLARRGAATEWHARIMDASGVLNTVPDRYESVLK
ncbi:MAG: hypothetical protein IPM18_03765 [Phycisphaerales bacterium]|nr:hypothetical protein [Phycisphaerales bacterium]